MNAREAFEKWCASVGFSIQQEIDKPGSYFWSQTKKAWDMWEIAWKACVASHTAQESRGDEFRVLAATIVNETNWRYGRQNMGEWTDEVAQMISGCFAGKPFAPKTQLNDHIEPPVPQTVNVEEEK